MQTTGAEIEDVALRRRRAAKPNPALHLGSAPPRETEQTSERGRRTLRGEAKRGVAVRRVARRSGALRGVAGRILFSSVQRNRPIQGIEGWQIVIVSAGDLLEPPMCDRA